MSFGRLECPECGSRRITYDEQKDEYICKECGLDFVPGAVRFSDIVSVVTVLSEGSGETRVLRKEETPQGDLYMVLTQKQRIRPRTWFNPETGEEEEIHPFWNPLMARLEDRPVQDILADVTIPAHIWQRFKKVDSMLNRTEAALVLLGLLGTSYPTSALGEAIGVTTSTGKRIISTLAGDNYLTVSERKGFYGGTTSFEGQPYRVGAINEAYRVLTDRGYEEHQRILDKLITFWGETGPELVRPIGVAVTQPVGLKETLEVEPEIKPQDLHRVRRIEVVAGEEVERGLLVPTGPVIIPTAFTRPAVELVGKGGKMFTRREQEADLTQEEVGWYVGTAGPRGTFRRPWILPKEEWERVREEFKAEERKRPSRERLPRIKEITTYLPYPVAVEKPGELAERQPELEERAKERLEEYVKTLPECGHPSAIRSPTGERICLICGVTIKN